MTGERPTPGDGRATFVKPGRRGDAGGAAARAAVAARPAATGAPAPAPVPVSAPTWEAEPSRALPAPFEPAPIPGEGSWLGPVEVIALACTGIGWLLPGPGWLVGIVAVLISSRWTAGEKALAIIGPVVLIAIPFVGFMSTVFDPGLDGLSSALGWLVALFVVAVAVWPAAATYLWVKGRRRALGRPS